MSLLSKCEETTLYKLEPKFTNLYTAPNPDRLYAPALFLSQVPSQYIRESDSFSTTTEFLFQRHWHMVSDKLLPNLYWLKNKAFFLLTVVNNSWMYLSFMFLFCPAQIPSGWLGTLDNIFETSIVLFQLNPFELYTLKVSEPAEILVEKRCILVDFFPARSRQCIPTEVCHLALLRPYKIKD